MFTNTTPNYNLPQYVGTDHIDPVADFNPSFERIDLALKENADGNVATREIADNAKTSADQSALKATTASNDVASLRNEIAELTELVSELQRTITSLNIPTLSADVTDLKSRVTILENRVEVVTITESDYELLSEEEKTDANKWFGIIPSGSEV